MKYSNLIVILLLIMIISCSYAGNVKNMESEVYTIQYDLQFSKMTRLAIDSETTQNTWYIQFLEKEGQSILIKLNKHDNSLCLYDIESQKQITKIKYEMKGGDGVGEIEGFYYYCPDSIFIFNDWEKELYLTNDQGKVLYKYPSFKNFIVHKWSIMLSTASQIRKINNKIIINAYYSWENGNEEEDAPITYLFDIKTQQVSFANRYPEQYKKYHWGGFSNYRLVRYTVNSNNEMVLSFGVDHYIHVYSFDTGETRNYYAGSASIKNIKSLNFPKGYPTYIPRDILNEHFYRNPSYSGIFHDQYRNVYYRIAWLPNDNSRELENVTVPKQLVVIILNEKFEYIGESKMLKGIDYMVSNCFVTKEGFHIQVLIDDTEEDENFMTFYTYNLVKI
jgi:hypothetical protein